ncbi:hypothetical protein ACFSL4_11240 [Streptomyces caeni]|uniref:Carbohydrate ABC transporter permease n=1 Tax=Streptomyces caeni TaxID=2307231 RepID=A0ABW4IN58_9ACTN
MTTATTSRARPPRRVRRGGVIGNGGLYLATGVAALLFLIPLLFVFLFLQRWLVQGITQTGIKG